jgi:hypothetical protein
MMKIGASVDGSSKESGVAEAALNHLIIPYPWHADPKPSSG